MHSELVKRLRYCLSDTEDCAGCPYQGGYKGTYCMNGLISEAADAIEELSRRETPMKITEIHVDEYYCPACGAENNCDQGHVQDAYCPACGQRLLPQPPREAPDA